MPTEVEAALLGKAPQDGEAAVAADADEGIEGELAIAVDQLRRRSEQRPVRHREGEGIALVGRAEDVPPMRRTLPVTTPTSELLVFERPAQQPIVPWRMPKTRSHGRSGRGRRRPG